MDELQRLGLPEEIVVRDVVIDYEKELGRGAETTVYEGDLLSPVAVKVLHSQFVRRGVGGGHGFMLAEFGQECNRLRSLTHPNVVQFMGVCEARTGSPGLVMELMDTTLEKYYSSRPLTVLEQIRLFCDVAAGLGYIHSKGVIHRDLTSRNVLLTSGAAPRAKLADVGVARSIYGDNVFSSASVRMTMCPGTMNYMAPEALSASPVYTEKLDVFSFGVLMMAVIVRREPPGELMVADRNIVHADGNRQVIPELERRAADFSAIPEDHPSLSMIIRCLQNDPEHRPSARQLYNELSTLRRNLESARSSSNYEMSGSLATVTGSKEHIQVGQAGLTDEDDEPESSETVALLGERDSVMADKRGGAVMDALPGIPEITPAVVISTPARIQQVAKRGTDESVLFMDKLHQHASQKSSCFLCCIGPPSPFGQWSPLNLPLPDDLEAVIQSTVHVDHLYVVTTSKSRGCVCLRSRDKFSWQTLPSPANTYACHGLLSHNGRLFFLSWPKAHYSDPYLHPILYELVQFPDNPDHLSWRQLPSGRCPLKQWSPALFGMGNNVVLAAGWDGVNSVDVITEYDLEQHRWLERSRCPKLPVPLARTDVVLMGNSVQLIGGGSIAYKQFNVTCKSFRLVFEGGQPCGSWDTNVFPDTPRSACGACAVHGNLVVAGGLQWPRLSVVREVFVFAASSQQWLQLPMLSRGRSRPSMVVFQQSLLAIGGSLLNGQFCNMAEELIL